MLQGIEGGENGFVRFTLMIVDQGNTIICIGEVAVVFMPGGLKGCEPLEAWALTPLPHLACTLAHQRLLA